MPSARTPLSQWRLGEAWNLARSRPLYSDGLRDGFLAGGRGTTRIPRWYRFDFLPGTLLNSQMNPHPAAASPGSRRVRLQMGTQSRGRRRSESFPDSPRPHSFQEKQLHCVKYTQKALSRKLACRAGPRGPGAGAAHLPLCQWHPHTVWRSDLSGELTDPACPWGNLGIPAKPLTSAYLQVPP